MQTSIINLHEIYDKIHNIFNMIIIIIDKLTIYELDFSINFEPPPLLFFQFFQFIQSIKSELFNK